MPSHVCGTAPGDPVSPFRPTVRHRSSLRRSVGVRCACCALARLVCLSLAVRWCVRSCFAFSFQPMFAVDLSSQCVLKYCCKQSVIFFPWKEGILFFSFVFFLFFLCFCLWFVSVRILLRTCVTGDPAHLPAVFLFIAALFRRCRDGAKRWSEGVCWILGICLWGFCCHGSRVNKHVWRYDGSGYDAAGARANEPFTSWGSAADAARG